MLGQFTALVLSLKLGRISPEKPDRDAAASHAPLYKTAKKDNLLVAVILLAVGYPILLS